METAILGFYGADTCRRVCVCTRVHIYISLFACMYVRKHGSVCVFMNQNLHICTYIDSYIGITNKGICLGFLCICANISIYIYIYAL